MSQPDLPPGCTLRPAQATDLPTIRALVRAAQLDPTQLRWPQFWVIEHAEEVVACGQLRRFPGALELGSLVTAPAWRGQGLGAILMQRLIAEATLPLFLECRAPLVPYYRRFGFALVPWRTAPGAMRLKFGLSQFFSVLSRVPIAVMRYAPPNVV